MAYELAVVPIESIDFGNRRREDYGDLETFAKTMDLSDGMMHPIFVQRHPTQENRYLLIGGGRRYMASLFRKELEVPVRIASGTFDTSLMKLLELIENVQRKDFDWKEQVMLELDIHQLQCEKETGWNQERTAELLNKKPSALSEELQLARFIASGDAPDLLLNCQNMAEARTVYGRIKKDAQRSALTKAVLAKAVKPESPGVSPLLHLADNYVVGDALTHMRELRDEAFDMVEVDPPYGIDYDKSAKTLHYTEVNDADYDAFLNSVCSETYRLAKPNSFIVFWTPVYRYAQTYSALVSAGWKLCAVPLMWTKPGTNVLNNQKLQLASGYEVAFYGHKGVPTLNRYGRSNVFVYPTLPAVRRIHHTERPFDLMTSILDTFVGPGSLILSPFLGSGVTIMAAASLNMNCIGFDLSPQHKDNFIAKLSSGWNTYHNNNLEEFEDGQS